MEQPHPHRRTLAPITSHQDSTKDDNDGILLPNPVGSAARAMTSVISDNRAALIFLRKLGFGALAAVHAGLVLAVVMAVAVLAGVGAVRMWAEEPLFLEEPLHFDYTEVQPSAKLVLGGIGGRKMERGGVPVGHTFSVSISLALPESDFNLRIGVFQVTAEIVSTTGHIMATSSRPCMLRFRSVPVRVMQTFIMGLPLLMGIFGETQEIRVEILKHKEGYPRTEAIKVILKPRAGGTALPDLYAARIIITSQLPWRKELVRRWKWTSYVWSSLWAYIMLLMLLVSCCKPIIFPMMSIGDHKQRDQFTYVVRHQQSSLGGDGEVSDEFSNTLSKWHHSRCKRKSLTIRAWAMPDAVNRDKTDNGIEETGDAVVSESENESC